MLAIALAIKCVNGLSKLFTELIKSCNVGLDRVKLTEYIVLREVVIVWVCLLSWCTLQLVQNEGSIQVVGKRRWLSSFTLSGDFLPQTLDRHFKNTIFLRVLQSLLCVFLVTHNEHLSLGLNILKGTLLLGHRVLESESLNASLLSEMINLLDNLVAMSFTVFMLLSQSVVRTLQCLVP